MAPEPALVGRAVELDHRAVERLLVGGVEPAHRLGELAVHVGHRPRARPCRPRRRRRRAARPPRTRRSRRPRAPPRARRRRSAAPRRPRRWGCRGCRGSAARAPARSRSSSPPPRSLIAVGRPPQRELGVDARRRRPPARPRAAARPGRPRGDRSDGRRSRRASAPSSRRAWRAASRGCSPKSSPPRSSSRLIWFQLRTTSPAVSASRSPNTCGWRRISFSRQCSATAARSPCAALLEQQRQEVDLEEHVAELVEQLGVVARVGGVGQLVRLLDRVRARSSARPARGPTGTRAAAAA